ncbi:MAG: hypothetical protein WAM70_02600 [Pyrinomonadaceae bacterium]
MKRDFLQQHRNRMRAAPVFVAVFAVLSTAVLLGYRPAADVASASAAKPAMQVQSRPWTAVGSTGVVDEATFKNFAFGTTDIGFAAGATGTVVVARYNVTNTFDNNANPNKPGWTTLEMGSNAPLNTIIEARLYQVKTCDQQQTLICTARNRSMDNPCAKCTIQGTIDFTNNLYYVEVTLNRNSPNNQAPRMYTLRLL